MTVLNKISLLVSLHLRLFLDWICQVFAARYLCPLTEENLLSNFSKEERRLLLSEALTRRWWYDGCTILLKCFREDTSCTLSGRRAIENRMIEVLRNRLAITRCLTSVDLSKCPVTKPIFIIGSTRTCSTFLQALLCQDPQNTSPCYYELMSPVPDGNASRVGAKDARVRTFKCQLDSLYDRLPNTKAVHYIAAEEPYECFSLFNNMGIFKSYGSYTRNNGTYLEWVMKRTKDEMAEAYRLHKKQLQLILLSRNEYSTPNNRRLILKESLHSAYLEALMDAYPDALFIHTYRDPVEVAASTCSNLEHFRKCSGFDLKAIDREALGKVFLKVPWRHGGREMLKFRQEHRDEGHRFIDIDYKELVASPMTVVKRIYEKFGLSLTNHGRERMERYVLENPQNKYGRHRYDLKNYGLTEDEIREHFKEYIAYFDIYC